MADGIVFGESVEDLAGTKLESRMEVSRRRTAVTAVPSPAGGAFERAMFRAEADLLLADVAAMAGGGYRERTQSQRRVDAVLLVMEGARSRAGRWSGDPRLQAG